MIIYLKNFKRAKFRYQMRKNRYLDNYFEQIYFLIGITNIFLN